MKEREGGRVIKGEQREEVKRQKGGGAGSGKGRR